MPANRKKKNPEDVTILQRSLRSRSSASDAGSLSLLSNNTEVDVPKRKSWYSKIPRHSTNMRDVFGVNFHDNENFDIRNIIQPAQEGDQLNTFSVPKLSTGILDGISESSDNESLGSIHRSNHRLFAKQPAKVVPKFSNMPMKSVPINPEQTAFNTDTMSDSSTNETLESIRKPQGKLFNRKTIGPPKKFQVSKRESLQTSKTVDGSIFINTEKKTLFGRKNTRLNPVDFPISIENATHATIVANVSGKTVDKSARIPPKKGSLFAKKTVSEAPFPVSLISESDEESIQIPQKLVILKKKHTSKFSRRISVTSRSSKRAHSPESVCSEFTEIDAWKLLPSSTMVGDEMLLTSTPAKRPCRDFTIDVSQIELSRKKSGNGENQINITKENKSKNDDQNKVIDPAQNKYDYCSQITQENCEKPTAQEVGCETDRTEPNGNDIENEAGKKESENHVKVAYRGHGGNEKNYQGKNETRIKEGGTLEKCENYTDKRQELNEEEDGINLKNMTEFNDHDASKSLLEKDASVIEENEECSTHAEDERNQCDQEQVYQGITEDTVEESILRSESEEQLEDDTGKELEDDSDKETGDYCVNRDEDQEQQRASDNEPDSQTDLGENKNENEKDKNYTDESNDENKREGDNTSHDKSIISDNTSKEQESEDEMETMGDSLVSESEDKNEHLKQKTSPENTVQMASEEKRGDEQDESEESEPVIENGTRKVFTATNENEPFVTNQLTHEEDNDVFQHDIQNREDFSKNSDDKSLYEQNGSQLQENPKEHFSQFKENYSQMQKNECQDIQDDRQNESKIEENEDQSRGEQDESEVPENVRNESEMQEENEQNESDLQEDEQNESEVQEKDEQNESGLQADEQNESEVQEDDENESDVQEEDDQNESDAQEEDDQNESDVQEEDDQNGSDMQEENELIENLVQEDEENECELQEEDEENEIEAQEECEEDEGQEEINGSTEQRVTHYEHNETRVGDQNDTIHDDNKTNESVAQIHKDTSEVSQEDRTQSRISSTDKNNSYAPHNNSTNKNKQSLEESRRFTRSVNMGRTIDPARLEGTSRTSVEFSKNISDPRSSSEGSGWNSHTTAHIQRKSMMNMTDARKSLRSMVLSKQSVARNSTKPINVTNNVNITVDFNDANYENHDYELARPSVPTRVTFANMTPTSNTTVGNTTAETSVDSPHTVQTKLNSYFNAITKEYLQKKEKIKEKVKNSIKKPESNPNFEVPSFETCKRYSAQQEKSKAKKTLKQHNSRLDVIVDGAVYRPPKLYKPPKASWITAHLYRFLDTKLRSRYGNRTRIESERFVQLLYEIYKHCVKRTTDVRASVEALKMKMALMGLVNTHWDFYTFLREYMPQEFRLKTVPDIINRLPMPADPFSVIIPPNH